MRKSIITTQGSGAVLVLALFVGNVLNFVFNAYLGRVLEFHHFALVTLINTLSYLLLVVASALSATTNHEVSFLTARYTKLKAYVFHKNIKKQWLLGSMLCAFIVVIASPFLASFFRESSATPILLFSPAVVIALILAIDRGYLTGALKFKAVGALIAVEAISKLILAVAIVMAGFPQWAYLSIPLSLVMAFIAAQLFLLKSERPVSESGKVSYQFPKRFFAAALVTSLSSIAFLSVDVLLAKHYLDPTLAGQYGLLSLVGKIIFFIGALLNTFMMTMVTRAVGEHKNPRPVFYKIFLGTSLLSMSAFVIVGPFGNVFVPMLFGARAAAIVPYTTLYTLAILLFTLANSVVIYRLARRQYIFPFMAVAASIIMAVSIVFFHDNIRQIINAVLIVSTFNFVVLMLLDIAIDHGRNLIRWGVDLVDLFFPLPSTRVLAQGKKRILIFNWRDLQHRESGGAEVYISEIAKRWAKSGHRVTLFCGNDGKSARFEVMDNIEIIRRGGFYFVYFWAFWYYIIKFRNKYDVVIDCQNGIPFFTPLYVKEKVFCVVYHVHQEVFKRALPSPIAWFAGFLEREIMPYAYRSARFIAISESTREDMQKYGIVGQGIDLVYSGIDIDILTPGQKASKPLILYLGRLKAYKSIDVLIKAFKKITKNIPDARLVIAGGGDEKHKLQQLTVSLGLKERVIFTDKVSEEKKLSLLQKAWVFVYPSMMEGWGISALEANACATPVVASDVPGLRESVRNPHTGYLVEHGNVNKFARRIEELLTDHKLRNKMSKNAVSWAAQFSWQKSYRNFTKLIT